MGRFGAAGFASQNLHLELLRQFTLQQQEMAEMMENLAARQVRVTGAAFDGRF